MEVYEILEKLKANLERLDIFKNIFIGKPKGVDKSINTPFALIIVEQLNHKGITKDVIVQIVIVFDFKNDTKKLYDEFFKAEKSVRESLFTLPYKIEPLATFLDEDRLETLKAGIIRFKVAGV